MSISQLTADRSRSDRNAKALLFAPVKLGALTLSHRVVHAPTTRLRAAPDESPSAMMVDYYAQRASEGGLLITESAHPSYNSRGYHGAPGIYTDAHVDGWKKVTQAVHAKGGRIIMQIAHDGRQSHVDLSNGAAPIAPSVVPFEGQALTQSGWLPVSPHRALDIDEIPGLVDSFAKPPSGQRRRVSTASRSTTPTVISSIHSCRMARTNAPTLTVVLSKIAPG